MGEPLTTALDPERCRRLNEVAALAARSTHALRGHLQTLLGLAEVLAAEEADEGESGYGRLLFDAARKLQFRLESLLFLQHWARGPQSKIVPEPLHGMLRELTLNRDISIEANFPTHQPVALDRRGLRCLLEELVAWNAREGGTSLAFALLSGEGRTVLEITCEAAVESTVSGEVEALSGSPANHRGAEGELDLKVIAALAASLGGSMSMEPTDGGRRRLCSRIPTSLETSFTEIEQ